MQRPHALFKLKCFVFILIHNFYNDSYSKETYVMALPCHLRAVFTTRFVYKGHAHQLLIRHDFNCHINERKTPTTCLTNHKSSISHHITPLVIHSLGGGHTHTHAYSHRGQKQFQETRCTPAKGWRTPGLTKIVSYTYVEIFLNIVKAR